MNASPDAAFEKAFATVQTLVDNFQANEKFYLSPQFSEADARLSFIDKFWTALGWDVNHETQTNPYQQEVKVEKPGQGAAAGKRADYAFSIAPDFHNVRFYVEAKKPSRHLKNADDYFQTTRYGWSSGPLSVLTDFEEFHILDCRFKPDIATALQTWNRIYHYREYSQREKFAEIYYLFGRDAVASGSLEKFAADYLPKSGAASKRQRGSVQGGTQSLDESFLEQLDEYRAQLSKAFKADNPELDALQLTEATQRVLDRLVFMRFLEDKLIEPEKMLAEIGAKNEAWHDFKKQTVRLDGIYNGVVFKKHFIDEAGFNTHRSSAVFGDICDELASNYSPYNFNAIPIHILGSIYERFLGKVIVADESGVRVDEKPEVRKAGGVYYTPEYIVRYIVEQTVGQLVEGKTPGDIAELRVADIACGSGSFLLGVYDRLLNFYTAFYNRKKNAAAARRAGCIEREGAFYLSLWQRREILLRHVFGVDIDAQAVEVAQISLYLKLLEDETTASAREANTLHGAILPSLTNNIVRGNSLIGTDILLSGLFVQQDEDARAEELKLCPMDFEDAFPKIMKSGGFDAIVGNPPYGADLTSFARNYLAEKFKAGITDTAALMMLQAQKITNRNGLIGFIVPKPFAYSSNWKSVRDNLINDLQQLADVGKVWKKVKLEQCVFIAERDAKTKKYKSLRRNEEEIVFVGEIEKKFCEKFGFLLNGISAEEMNIGLKMSGAGKYLNDFVTNTRGGMFQSELKNVGKGRRVIGGVNVQPFFLTGAKGYVDSSFNFPVNAFVQAESILVQNIVAHIANPTDHIQIIVAVATKEDAEKIVILDTVNQLVNSSNFSSYYFLGLLSSRLINWYVYRFIFAKAIRTMHFDGPVTSRIPMPDLSLATKQDKAQHDKLVKFVEQMLAAKRDEAAAATESDKTYFANKCRSLDRRIDALVYELYGLTDEEIALVESA